MDDTEMKSLKPSLRSARLSREVSSLAWLVGLGGLKLLSKSLGSYHLLEEHQLLGRNVCLDKTESNHSKKTALNNWNCIWSSPLGFLYSAWVVTRVRDGKPSLEPSQLLTLWYHSVSALRKDVHWLPDGVYQLLMASLFCSTQVYFSEQHENRIILPFQVLS